VVQDKCLLHYPTTSVIGCTLYQPITEVTFAIPYPEHETVKLHMQRIGLSMFDTY